MTIEVVFGRRNISSTSMNSVPLTGSRDADAVVWRGLPGWSGTRLHRSACPNAKRCDIARLEDVPGMMPILHSPAVITPGQFGPISRDFDPERERFNPHHVEHRNASVMQTISGISASMASQIASAAPGGRLLPAKRATISVCRCSTTCEARDRTVPMPA